VGDECVHRWRPYRKTIRDRHGVIHFRGHRCSVCGWWKIRVAAKPRTRLGMLRLFSAFEQAEAIVVEGGGTFSRKGADRG
jgi:hypothetical protein